jgi:phosphoribosyl 1,2-cyclic phosphate phosphodiesterase
MEMILLGTSAAEGWPAPFCVCNACEEARKLGGKNVRTRSGALIDDDLKIDFGPDTVTQLQRCGRNLAKLRTILFTHQHTDHFTPAELEWASRPFTLTPPAPIELWGNSAVMAGIAHAFRDSQNRLAAFVLREFKPGDHFTTAAGDEVDALPADHVAGASVLRIRRGGKTIFYGHDSGFYPPPTIEALSDNTPLDIALFDCTSGGATTQNRGHMDAGGVIQTVADLRRRGAIADHTRVIATHFSHNGGLLHEQLAERFKRDGVEVAFDGMVVTV